MINRIKKLIGIRENLKEEELEDVVFEGAVALPKIGCFCSNVFTPLIGLCGSDNYIDQPFREIRKLIKRTVPKETLIDIAQIDSISHSSSDQKYFESIVEFGRITLEYALSNEPTQNNWTIEGCKRHSDSDLFGRRDTQCNLIAWNGRLEICNSGGSHHFAVARYRMTIGESYPGGSVIKLPMAYVFIDEAVANNLTEQWHFFIISDDTLLKSIQGLYRLGVDYLENDLCRYSLSKESKKTKPTSYKMSDRIIAIDLKEISLCKKRTKLLSDLINASHDEIPQLYSEISVGKKCIDLNKIIYESLSIQNKNSVNFML